jgi:hypothetical protein
VIWQYWETVGDDKPAFIDGLHAIARKNAGTEIVLVTPETLGQFIPDIPSEIFKIAQIAHKADMIRAMLVMRYGGMWLDSDAIVLRRLDWILDLLDTFDFVCFNDGCLLEQGRPWVRVNCFASCAGGQVVSEWVRQQHVKFPRTQYGWEEIGTELLHPICLANKERVKVLPFDKIAPVRYNQTSKFMRHDTDASAILRDCYVVMLSNQSLKERTPVLRTLTIEQIASGDYLLSAIIRHAMDVSGMRPRKD